MRKLRTGDPVIVITGKYKGKVSSITKIDEDRVWVKGVNEVKKAVKGKGFIKKHLSIHISNVSYYDEAAKKPTRVSILIAKDGKKTRRLVQTNKEIK